jgi:hypothetical protein
LVVRKPLSIDKPNEPVMQAISADTKEAKTMPVPKQFDLNEVEELATQGVAVNTIGIKLGMNGGWGSYQAKHNPAFLAAFNRGRASAGLEPFQAQARKSPGANGSRAKVKTNGKPVAGKNGRVAKMLAALRPPPSARLPLTGMSLTRRSRSCAAGETKSIT